MRKVLGTLALSLLLLSCQNKSRQEYSPTLTETQSEESYQLPDTAVTEEVKERQEEVKVHSTPTSFSSSRSHESSSYVNMRGFDPASEDDMEDNGMSRYMENNDEEGWD
jgi:hypothetical protein